MESKRVQVAYNCSADELERWKRAASASGVSLANWLRESANRSAKLQAARRMGRMASGQVERREVQ